ncbi:hypothetical protein BH23THE1_BH23THE1_31690 [soil metagenome]
MFFYFVTLNLDQSNSLLGEISIIFNFDFAFTLITRLGVNSLTSVFSHYYFLSSEE